MDELQHPGAPPQVAAFAISPPVWLVTVEVESDGSGDAILVEASGRGRLDPGEIAAIRLAATSADSLLLMDEMAGRAEAARQGIRTTGTLGILRDAAMEGYVELGPALDRLGKTSFRAPSQVVAQLLAEDAGRGQR